jgi:hypothetical protein
MCIRQKIEKQTAKAQQRPIEPQYNNSIKFIPFIYVQNLTAQRPITKFAQARKWEE